MFGLKTACSSFQALMDAVLEECNIEGIMAYQGDLIVASNTFQKTYNKLKVFIFIIIYF